MTRREIVEPTDVLPVFEQGFNEIGTDKTSCAGHEPCRLATSQKLRQCRSKDSRTFRGGLHLRKRLTIAFARTRRSGNLADMTPQPAAEPQILGLTSEIVAEGS